MKPAYKPKRLTFSENVCEYEVAMGPEELARNILSTDQSTIDKTKAPKGHTEVLRHHCLEKSLFML